MFVIFGGIRAGIFTAVESASDRRLVRGARDGARLSSARRGASFAPACMSAAHTAGIILFVISAAAAFGWLLAYLEVPAQVVAAIRVSPTTRSRSCWP